MYGKLFAQMYDGTLATKGPWQALVTFQQLVILADKYGTVDMTPQALARRTTIPLDVIELGISELEKKDSDSRSPDEGGRRIVRLSANRVWGWRIVNYGHYRRIRSEEERREYHKLYQRKRRAAKAAVKSVVNTSTLDQHNQPMAVRSKQRAVSSKHITPAIGGKLRAAELLKAVRQKRNPQFPTSLVKGALDDFSVLERRVIAAQLERILTSNASNDGVLVAQLAQMLAEADNVRPARDVY